MEKLTYVKALEVAIEAVADEEVKEKLAKLKARVADSRDSKKPTKNQVANEGIKDVIYDILVEANKGLTVTEILATKRLDADVVNQKVSALLRQMIAEGRVVKEIDKKKSLFKAVVETAE